MNPFFRGDAWLVDLSYRYSGLHDIIYPNIECVATSAAKGRISLYFHKLKKEKRSGSLLTNTVIANTSIANKISCRVNLMDGD